MQIKRIDRVFPKLEAINFSIKHNITKSDDMSRLIEAHIHDCCEIYVNISGDVSFMVENNVYPIRTGSIIITRPYEYHHCIYNSDKLHEHYWVLFSSNGNEAFLSDFFDRSPGESNLINPEDTPKLIQICQRLCGETADSQTSFFDFVTLLEIIGNGKKQNDGKELPPELVRAVDFFHSDFAENISVKDASEHCHVSMITLERYFQQYIRISPGAYLRSIRLNNASRLLKEGFPVTQVCFDSGFSDYSHFIQVFRKHFGITPLKYQKKAHNE